jgi:MFS family permease
LFVHGKGQIWLIYLVAFLYGLAYTFLSAGQSALLKVMLPDELIGDARGMLSTVREGLRLFGPLTGAGLFALAGDGVVAVVDAATFAIAAFSLLFVKVEETKALREDVHWLVEVTAGVRHIWASIVLRQMIIAGGITLLVVGFSESICFAVVSQGLHRPPTFLGVVLTAQRVGAIISGPTAAPLARRIGEGPLMGFGLVLAAAGAGLFAIPSLAGVMAGAIVFGAGLPWIVVGAYTMLQVRTPLELQGRVSAAADTLLSTPQILSIAVGAWLVGIVNYQCCSRSWAAPCWWQRSTFDPQATVGEAAPGRGCPRAGGLGPVSAQGSCDARGDNRCPRGLAQAAPLRGLIAKHRSSSLPKA